MRALEIIVGLTVTALILYYFVGQADTSSKFIQASSNAYVNSLLALQGRGPAQYLQ
jgi:hypothetical protein